MVVNDNHCCYDGDHSIDFYCGDDDARSTIVRVAMIVTTMEMKVNLTKMMMVMIVLIMAMMVAKPLTTTTMMVMMIMVMAICDIGRDDA